MSTTLHDHGRTSERFGDIAHFYAFPYKFWFRYSMMVPEDVATWCRENCTGYYKVYCYTHEDSVRGKDGKYKEKIMYVDRIFLQDEGDAALIKLAFKVSDQQVSRPKLTIERKPRAKRDPNAPLPTSPEGIAAATRRHAAIHGKKGMMPKIKRKPKATATA
jgi:hypothetical protein